MPRRAPLWGRVGPRAKANPWMATKGDDGEVHTRARSGTLQRCAGRSVCAQRSPSVDEKRLDWPAITRRPLLAAPKRATF